MPNVFDQFDERPAPAPPPRAANVFDQFDEPVITASGASRFDDAFAGPTAQHQKPRSAAEAKLQAALRERADAELVGQPGAGNAALAGLYRFGNSAGLNLPRNAAAGIATGLGKVGVPGYPERSFAQNYELSKEQEEALARQHPVAAGAGTVGGIVAGAVALPGFQAAEGANLAARIGANALSGAAYAGAAELADTKDVGEAGKAALIGGATAGVITPAAEKLGRMIGNWRTTKVPYLDPDGAFTPTAREALEKQGINLAEVPDDIIAAFKAKGPGEDVIRETVAARQGIKLSQGQAEQDLVKQQREYAMAQSGEAFGPGGTTMRDFFEQQRGQFDAAREAEGIKLAGGQDRVATPREAAETVARRGEDLFSDLTSREAEATARADAALGRLRGVQPVPGERGIDPLDAGNTAREAVRARAATDRAGYQESYNNALSREGSFDPQFFRGLADDAPTGTPEAAYIAPISERIGRTLAQRERPIIVDPAIHPLAAGAMRDLDRIDNLTLGMNGQPGASQVVSGVNLQGINQARKILSTRANSGGGSPEDRMVLRRVIDAFDDELERGLDSTLFQGDPGALDALRGARSQFAAYKRTYGPTQAGDSAGNALKSIVERDATPEQVSNFLYGSSLIDRSGRSSEVAGRLREMLGAQSPEFRTIQQGYIAKVLGSGDLGHDAMASRIQTALTGEGRRLAYNLLDDTHIRGLRDFQAAAQQARTIRESVPDWVADLAKGQFNANTVANNLWGKATVGGNKVSATYAAGLKRALGETSPEWKSLRQAVWQKLTEDAASETNNFGVQRTATNVGKFLTGDGRSLANAMFSAEEQAAMRQFQRTAEILTPLTRNGVRASPGSATSPTLLAATAEKFKRNSNRVALLLGAGALGTGQGWMAAGGAAGLGKVIGTAAQKVIDRGHAKQAKAFTRGAGVKTRPGANPIRARDASKLAIGAALASGK